MMPMHPYPSNDSPYPTPIVLNSQKRPDAFVAEQSGIGGNMALGVPLSGPSNIPEPQCAEPQSVSSSDTNPTTNENNTTPPQVNDNSTKKRKVRKFTEQ